MMLEVKNISKRYGEKEVLKSINLFFEDGLYGLLGENGAGKTTLIHLLTGLLKSTSGEVIYNKKNITKLKNNYRKILGYMPQYSSYYSNFTAQEFLKYICCIKGIPKKEQKGRIEEMLERVNLADERKKKIGNYSGGMRQRIGIAQAMINEPKILILDEPTAGLDPGERIRFREFISEMNKGRIIILATHIVQDVEYIADQVILLHQGQFIIKEKPDILIEKIKEKVVSYISPKGEATLEDVFMYYTGENKRKT